MQESTDPTRLGPNRTGLQMSPLHAKQMSEILEQGPDGNASDALLQGESAFAAVRQEYIEEADALGSVPAPRTLKGVAKSGAQMMTGNRPQAFIDKLAERLAFERGGTRLYDAVLAKFDAFSDELQDATVADVREIRDEEAEHALLIKECMEQLGADPTAQTPCADLTGVETMGLIQVATDPRTTLAQTLHAALVAELTDNDGWETLILMAENMGLDDMAERFREALVHEGEHLAKVREWYNELTLETGKLVS